MKKLFAKRAAVAVLSAAITLGSAAAYADEAALEINLVPEFVDDYSSVNQNFTPIDIAPYATTSVDDDIAGDGKGGWSDQGSINDFSPFKLKGNVKLQGIPFNIPDPVTNDNKSVIMLSGRDDKRLPLTVEVPIGQKAGGMYILHNNVWGGSTGASCGDYTYVYEDGTEFTIDQRMGTEIPSWWYDHVNEYCITAWSGTNNTTDISVSLYACVNPYPDKVISKVRFNSNNFCYIAILGITLTDIRPVLPKQEVIDWGNPDTTDWFIYKPCYDAEGFEGTPLDASWLNEKYSNLGHGKLGVEGDAFVYEDGTKRKMWGTNYMFNRYPTHEEADYEAKRLAQSGFNCIRISSPSQTEGNSTLYSIDHTTSRLLGINNETMDKYCYFLYALKREGLSVLLQQPNLARGVRSADNNIQDIESVGGSGSQFDPDIMALNNKASEMFLNYVNPYTGIKIAEDESVQFVYLYNEFSIFGDSASVSPYYYELLKEYFNKWLQRKYSTRKALADAWKCDNDSLIMLGDDEDQFGGSVEFAKQTEYYKYSSERVNDTMLFMHDLTIDKYGDRFEFFRSLGFTGRIIGSTIYGSVQLANEYANAELSDTIDVHNYNHLVHGAQTTPGNSIAPPKSDLDNGFKYFSWIMTHKLYDRAYTITEWNATIPNPFACETILMMPAFASMQNWSPFLFAWNEGVAQETLIDRLRTVKYLRDNRTFDLNEQPFMLYSLPAMSIMMRRGDITEPTEGFYPERFTNEEIYDTALQNYKSDYTYGLVGKTGVAFDGISYDESINSNEVLRLKTIGDKTGVYDSITGEMRTDLNNKLFLLKTDCTQAATGYLENKDIELSDVKLGNIKTKFATVILTSLSEDSLKECDSMLLTAVSRHRNWEQILTEQSNKFLSTNFGPIIMEQIIGDVVLKSYDDFKVYALGGDGRRTRELETSKTDEGYTKFSLTRDDETINYEIVRTKKSDIRCSDDVVFYDGVAKTLLDDLGSYEPYRTQVERTVMQGFAKQTGNRRYSPTMSVTRGQFADMLTKALDISGSADEIFADVSDSYEYRDAVSALKANGIVNGDSDGNYNPDSVISKSDALTMIKRAVKVKNKDHGADIWDDGAMSINATNDLNRAEVAVLLYNVLWK